MALPVARGSSRRLAKSRRGGAPARTRANPYRIHEYAHGTVETVPDIIEFVVSDRYLDRPNLYPRQATFLKVIFLQSELFTQYDHDVIGEWEETFLSTGTEGISPGIHERIRINKERGRPWFRETQGVIGRRGSKGFTGGLCGAYVLWNYMLRPGGPQAYYGIDRDKRLTGIVFAGKKEQARANQWQDIVNVVQGGPCFSPYISRPQAERLTIFAPTDILRQQRMDNLGVGSEADLASFEIIPAPSTTMAARGPTSFMQFYDEQAHVLNSTANADAEAVYDSATPALDQFKKDGFIYAPSSPWTKTGKFFQNWELAISMEQDGSPTYPERLMLQLPSWGPYEDWEEAHRIPLRPPVPTPVEIEVEVKKRRTVNGKKKSVTVMETQTVERLVPDSLGNFKPLKGAIQTYDEDMRQLERANPDTFKVERRCLDPDTRVLMADLTWRRIDDIEPGDLLVATDEFGESGTERKMRTAVVEAKADSYDTAYRIEFDDGTSVTCSGRHRWLANTSGSKSNFRWRSIEPQSAMGPRSVMKVGDQIRALVSPWEVDETREGGWLAGMYDGEGCVVSRSRTRTEFRIDLTQNPGPVLDRAREALTVFGFYHRDASHHSRKAQVIKVVGLSDCLRLLGQIRPVRLLQNGNPGMWEGRAFGHERGRRYAKTITSITKMAPQRLVDIQTSTRTFIAEGLVSHNSHWAESLSAYMNAKKVGEIFKPWAFEGDSVFVTQKSILSLTYSGHGDPSNSNKRFGWSLAHRVWVPEIDEDTGLPKRNGAGMHHVVFDKIRCWDPADYDDHILDYEDVMGDIWEDVKIFLPEDVSFDQFNVPATVGNLNKRLREEQLPKAVRVHEVSRTRQLNWRHYELFKSAINMGLVHAPMYLPEKEESGDWKVNYASSEVENELKFLEEKNGAVNHPTSGPVQTKDIADTMCEVTVQLIGRELATFLGQELDALGISGAAADGTNPERHTQASNSTFDRLGQATAGAQRGMGQHDPSRGMRRR